MKYYACDRCLTAVKVHGDPDSIQKLIVQHVRWKDGLPCVRTGCSSTMYAFENASSGHLGMMTVLCLTAEEFFSALCGYGLPDEIGSEPEVVQALLLSSKVIGAAVGKSLSGRAILSKLELENGTCLHLASARQGPTVYKVTRKRHDQKDDDLSILHQDTPTGAVHIDGRSGPVDCCGGHGDAGGGDTTRREGCCGTGGGHCESARAPQEIPRCDCDDDTRDDETAPLRPGSLPRV